MRTAATLGVAAPRWWQGARRHLLVSPIAVELSLLVVIAAVGFALRAQHLADIPRYTDEINEVLPAVDIARGHRFPLTSGPKHIGAAFDYVLALAILLFGKYPELPRQVVMATGLATIVLVYGYARSLGGRLAGLLAAGLLTASAPHVLVSSRVAWSASLTPLLFTGAAWSLERAVSRRQPRYVLATGALAGLALQCHPSVAALLPGLAVFVISRGRYLVRRPELYVGGLLFVAAYANVLVYNWQSSFGALRSINRQYPNEATGLAAYPANLLSLLRGLSLTVASAVDPTRAPGALDPLAVLIVPICLVALAYLAWRASALPLLVTLSAVVLMPTSREAFDPLFGSRYLMPLVPLAYVAVGVLGAGVLAMPGTGQSLALRRLVVGGVAATMLLGMLGSLLRFEALALANGCTNAPQRAFVAEIERHRAPGEWVLLDEGLVRPAERLGYWSLLEMSGKKVGETSLGRGGIAKELAERPTFLTAVDDGKAGGLFERQGLPLLPQTLLPTHPARAEPGPGGRRADGGIGLYRVSAQGAALLAHNPRPGCGSLPLN